MVVRQDASTGELTTDDQPVDTHPSKDSLHVKVWSPFQVYFDDEVRSISAVNSTGPFDVLARHHNFISLLNACELTLQTTHGEVKIKISGGVMHVRNDHVTVFLEV